MTTITPFEAKPRRSATFDVAVSAAIGVVLTVLSYSVGLKNGWENHLNWVEVIAVFTSYMSTWLCNVQRRFNYPMGVISSAFYAWLFFDSSLVASGIVNVYLCFYLFYGFQRWRADADMRPITLVSKNMWPVYILISAAGYFLVFEVAKAFGGSFLWTDSLILALTILSQVLLDNKKLENWLVWLVLDVFATYEYFHTHLYLVGFQYIFFTINTVVAFLMWLNAYRKQGRVTTRGGTGFMTDYDEFSHVVAQPAGS